MRRRVIAGVAVVGATLAVVAALIGRRPSQHTMGWWPSPPSTLSPIIRRVTGSESQLLTDAKRRLPEYRPGFAQAQMRLANDQFIQAQRHARQMQKGITTEQEVLSWFGPPQWTIDDAKLEQTSTAGIPNWHPANVEILQGHYPPPHPDERVLAYEFQLTDPAQSYTGRELTILITIDTRSGRVVEFQTSESQWMS